jgi:hypothetical protein
MGQTAFKDKGVLGRKRKRRKDPNLGSGLYIRSRRDPQEKTSNLYQHERNVTNFKRVSFR